MTSARCPDDITVHLDAGYDSQKTRDDLAGRGMTGEIAHKGDKAPIQAGQRWHVERTNAWHNAFNRLQRCYERNEDVIDAFFDLADAIITVRSLIRRGMDPLPVGRPPADDRDHLPIRAVSKEISMKLTQLATLKTITAAPSPAPRILLPGAALASTAGGSAAAAAAAASLPACATAGLVIWMNTRGSQYAGGASTPSTSPTCPGTRARCAATWGCRRSASAAARSAARPAWSVTRAVVTLASGATAHAVLQAADPANYGLECFLPGRRRRRGTRAGCPPRPGCGSTPPASSPPRWSRSRSARARAAGRSGCTRARSELTGTAGRGELHDDDLVKLPPPPVLAPPHARNQHPVRHALYRPMAYLPGNNRRRGSPSKRTCRGR